MARKKPKNTNRPPSVPFYLPFWRDTEGWEPDEQVVAFFLATCPEREHGKEGLFPMTSERVARSLAGRWEVARVKAAVGPLIERGWMLADQGWIFITNALEHDQPWGEKLVTAAVRRVEKAPRDSFVWTAFMDAAERLAPELHAALLEATPKAPVSVPKPTGTDTPRSPASKGGLSAIDTPSPTAASEAGTRSLGRDTTDSAQASAVDLRLVRGEG